MRTHEKDLAEEWWVKALDMSETIRDRTPTARLTAIQRHERDHAKKYKLLVENLLSSMEGNWYRFFNRLRDWCCAILEYGDRLGAAQAGLRREFLRDTPCYTKLVNSIVKTGCMNRSATYLKEVFDCLRGRGFPSPEMKEFLGRAIYELNCRAFENGYYRRDEYEEDNGSNAIRRCVDTIFSRSYASVEAKRAAGELYMTQRYFHRLAAFSGRR